VSADAIARVRRWLRGTVPGDLARVVGVDGVLHTDDVAAVLDALAAERARCAAVCREVSCCYDDSDVGSVVARACAEAIERGEVEQCALYSSRGNT
jgi:hypothetical protein